MKRKFAVDRVEVCFKYAKSFIGLEFWFKVNDEHSGAGRVVYSMRWNSLPQEALSRVSAF